MESGMWVPVAAVFVIGAVAGYALRAWISARRRRRYQG